MFFKITSVFLTFFSSICHDVSNAAMFPSAEDPVVFSYWWKFATRDNSMIMLFSLTSYSVFFSLNLLSGPWKQINSLELFLLNLGDYPTCKLCMTLLLFFGTFYSWVLFFVVNILWTMKWMYFSFFHIIIAGCFPQINWLEPCQWLLLN